MGRYVTSTSYSTIFPNFLKSNTTTSDAVGLAVMNQQTENAEGVIDATISNRYDISGFTSIPPLLRKLTEDIMIGNVVMKTGYAGQDRNVYMDDYNAARIMLQQLVDGQLNLTYTDGSIIAEKSSSIMLSNSENYTAIFGLDTQTSWKRDDDEIDDQSDART